MTIHYPDLLLVYCVIQYVGIGKYSDDDDYIDKQSLCGAHWKM